MPYPFGEILSGYAEDVTSIRDGFTASETILRRRIVDMTRAYAAFREAPARKHSPSSPRASLQLRLTQPFD